LDLKGKPLAVIVALSALAMIFGGMLSAPSASVSSCSGEEMSGLAVGVGAGDEGVTLFFDDFDDTVSLIDYEDLRSYRQGDVNWYIDGAWQFTAHSSRNGFWFINITDSAYNPDKGYGGYTYLWSEEEFRFAFVGIEMRLRFSSDNRLESDVGGGIRQWGFKDPSDLIFRSMSEGWLPYMDRVEPGGHPGREMIGFFAVSRIDGDYVYQRIEGIDITDWHTYTILWQPMNATFLVDDEVVASIDTVPKQDMKVCLNIASDQDFTFPCEMVGGEEVCTDECIQVDYVRVFTGEEQFQEIDSEISGLLSRVLQLIEDTEQKGRNSTYLREQYASAQNYWGKDQYIYHEAKELLDPIIEALERWDEVSEMFTNASQHIGLAAQAGMDTGKMERDYGSAEDSWAKFNYVITKWYLDRILDTQIPEAPLLPILGLILLPALLRKRA
jgi:hypothetical protein